MYRKTIMCLAFEIKRTIYFFNVSCAFWHDGHNSWGVEVATSVPRRAEWDWCVGIVTTMRSTVVRGHVVAARRPWFPRVESGREEPLAGKPPPPPPTSSPRRLYEYYYSYFAFNNIYIYLFLLSLFIILCYTVAEIIDVYYSFAQTNNNNIGR